MNRLSLVAALLIACSVTQPVYAKDVVTFEATVKTVDGKPVQGVTVVISYYRGRSAMSFGARRRLEVRATSDPRGRFRVDLPQNLYSVNYRVETPRERPLGVVAFETSHDYFSGHGDVPDTVQLALRMKVGTETLTGKVTDEAGKAVKGVVVTLSRQTVGTSRGQQGRLRHVLSTTTNAWGTYRFARLVAGSYGIHSVVPPRGTGLVPMSATWRGHGGVRLPSKDASHKDFQLKRGCAIRGRVIDEDGKPIVGAKVSASRAPAAIDGPTVYQRTGNFSDTALTDARGTYTLEGLSPETYQVTVASPEDADFAPSTPVTGLRCTLDKPVEGDDIVLVKGGVLEGRVTGADDRPLSAVRVYYGTRETETDAKGHYRFDRLPTGLHAVRIVPPDGSRWAARTIEMVPCLSKVTLRRDCKLPEGGSISGLVTAENGNPIEGVRVSANFSNYRYETRTDARGRYRLVGLVENQGVDYRKRPRRYGFVVSTSHDSPYMTAGEQLDVKLGETVGRDVILKLGASIRGEVIDIEGKPVPNARIEVYKNVGRGGRSYYGTAGPGPGRGLCTAADGTFTVQKIPDETLNVSARPEADVNLLVAERRGLRCRSGETTRVKLTLPPGGEIAGTVKTPRGGPIHGARVSLTAKRSPRGRSWGVRVQPVDTDREGRFRFVGLRNGAYGINVNVYDGEHLVKPATVEVTEGERTPVSMRAARGGFIEVGVTGPNGKPIESAGVQATPSQKGGMTGRGTVRKGVAVIGPLLPGTYTLQVRVYGRRNPPLKPATVTDVRVTADKRVKHSVRLEEGKAPTRRRR